MGGHVQCNQCRLGDTHLGFNPSCASSLQATWGKMLSIAGLGSSSSVKEGDDPPGVLKMEGGDICKTCVTDSRCQDSEKEGRPLCFLLQVGQEAGREEGAKLDSSDVPVRRERSCPLLTVLPDSGDVFANDENSGHSAECGPANLSQAEGALEDGFASLKNLLVEQIREGQG